MTVNTAVQQVQQQNVVVWGTSAIKILTTVTTGTYVIGETVTEAVSTATGTLKDTDSLTAPTYIILEPVGGTLTGGHALTGAGGAASTGGTKSTAPIQTLSAAGCNSADIQSQDASDAAWFTVDGSTPQAAGSKGSQKITANSDAIISVRLNGEPIKFLSATTKYPNLMVRLYA